jgi:hypothetical protein
VSGWLESHKPAAPVRVHLLLAASMWSLVGAVLLTLGCRWTWAGSAGAGAGLLAVGLLAGVLKSLLVLDRAGRAIAARITARGHGRCIGGFLSVRSWAMILVMAGGGRLLRSLPAARAPVGVLYVAVGIGLLLSSRLLWRALRIALSSS